MNEGVGSTSILVIIVVFIAFASAYMAYSVNYTKAFRMKNKIIAVYEKYDGDCNTACKNELKKYAKDIGYTAARVDTLGYCASPSLIPSGAVLAEPAQSVVDPGYCVYKIKEDGHESENIYEIAPDAFTEPGYYYHVLTCINIEMPIVEKVVPRFLTISGDTKLFYN